MVAAKGFVSASACAVEAAKSPLVGFGTTAKEATLCAGDFELFEVFGEFHCVAPVFASYTSCPRTCDLPRGMFFGSWGYLQP